ncbi:MAG: hypothetical protein CMI31_15735 [Opitutae bacterium]|nr:hypothetical protein [Opitutae bacterium]|tara:strand:- start:2883 stop:4043 length:1161 start_codon:yes stop_codon:yes gene_type:complete
MKFLQSFLLSLLFAAYSYADNTIYDWTNVDGQTIKARYIKSDDKTVTINMGGRIFAYPLAKLTPESQALAKKLGGEEPPPAPNGNNPFVKPDPGNPAKPPVDVKPDNAVQNVGGKILLPTIGEGEWARYYAVAENRNFDIAVHGSGRVFIFLKDSDGKVIGKPLRVSFRMGYYTKQDPKLGWPHAYYRDYAERHYKLRKVKSFETPSAPPSASGFRRLELIADHGDGVKLKMGFELSSNQLSVTGEPLDPRQIDHPSVMALSVTVPSFFEIKDEWKAPDWTPIVDDTTISAIPANARQAVDLPYLEKWADLQKKGIYPREIQQAELHGKLFGKRKVTLASRSFRDLRFRLAHYTGVFPFQDYHFIYGDSRNGGEIDRGRRLEIEIR